MSCITFCTTTVYNDLLKTRSTTRRKSETHSMSGRRYSHLSTRHDLFVISCAWNVLMEFGPQPASTRSDFITSRKQNLSGIRIHTTPREWGENTLYSLDKSKTGRKPVWEAFGKSMHAQQSNTRPTLQQLVVQVLSKSDRTNGIWPTR